MQTSNSQQSFFENLDNITAQQTERKEPDANTEKQFYDPNRKPGEQPAAPTENKPVEQPLNFDPLKSGQTSAYLAAGAIESVFTIVESLLFHYGRFSKGEITRAKEYLDKHEAGLPLEPKEKLLLAKFMRIREQHDKIRSRIPFPDEDIEAMSKGFAHYHKVTGKEMNPSLLLWATIIKALTNRTTDIFM